MRRRSDADVEIVVQRLGDAGILHLDGETAAVGVLGGVHLAERGGGQGRVVPPGEALLGRRAQFGGRRPRE